MKFHTPSIYHFSKSGLREIELSRIVLAGKVLWNIGLPARMLSVLIFSGFIFSSTAFSADYVVIDEHLGSVIPENLVFTGTDGKEVRLVDMINKPTIIAPVYYNCPGLCTPTMDGLVKLINRSDLTLGLDYQVINISFHYGETTDLAIAKKRNYNALLDEGKNPEQWHFMTGDPQNIDVLLETLGYSVIRRGEDIFHPAAIMILSPSGKIVKYIHGTKFNPVEFKMAVQKAASEETMPTITKIMKACFNYEPAGREKQRTFTILGFIVMVSIGVILLVVYPPLSNKN